MIYGSHFIRLGNSCSHVAAMLFKVEAVVRIGIKNRHAPLNNLGLGTNASLIR
jgi:hypothetical protein